MTREKLEHGDLVSIESCVDFLTTARDEETPVLSAAQLFSGEKRSASDGGCLYTWPPAASAGRERVNSPSELLRFPASCLYSQLSVLSPPPPPPILSPVPYLTQVCLCLACHTQTHTTTATTELCSSPRRCYLS